MTNTERQQSLINARLACEWLGGHVLGQLEGPTHNQLACLLYEFTRLDEGEQKRNAAGREFGHLGKQYGKKGGRPRGSTKGGKK